MREQGLNATGGYSFTLQSTNNPQGAVAMSYGDTQSTDINVNADVDVYSFTGTAGDVVQIPFGKALNAVSFFQPRVDIYDGAGAQVATASGNTGVTTATLPSNGTYFIWVREKDLNATGGYTFTLNLNPPPTIDITSPVDGDKVIEGDRIMISADAADDGSVASVAFNVDGIEQVSLTNAPYSFEFDVPMGISSFILEAIATDNDGASTTASRTVSVIADPLTTITGRVQDAAGGLVAGANIYVTKSGLSGVSAVDGRFSIADVSTILGDLIVRASGIINSQTVYGRSAFVTPVQGGTTDVGNLILNPFPLFSGERFAVPADVTDMLSLDINGDQIMDVAVINAAGELGVFLGYGDGRLEAQPVVNVNGSGVRSIEAADINNDGLMDFVVANQGSNTVSVFLARQDGSFNSQQDYSTGSAPQDVVMADISTDGTLDILTVNNASNDVSILLGVGDGTFLDQQVLSVGTQPSALALGDLDKDGNTDIVTVNAGSGDLSILMGAGAGTFTPETRIIPSEGVFSLGLEDMNKDTVLDIVSLSTLPLDAGGQIDIFLGNGDGSVQTSLTARTSLEPAGLILYDVNKDTLVDVLVFNNASGMISVFLNNGDGTLAVEQNIPMSTAAVMDMVSQDLNNDGRQELIMAVDQIFNGGSAKTLQVNMGKDADFFAVPMEVTVGDQPVDGASADFNGDGNIDIVTANALSNDVSLLLGNGDGTFAPETRMALGFNPTAIYTGDFNGDTLMDIVVSSAIDNTIFNGNGDGTFQAAQPFLDVLPADGPVDINGDGIDDQLTANTATHDISILLGIGEGIFGVEQRFSTGQSPNTALAVDVDNDGVMDVVTVNGGGSVSVLRGNK